MITFTIAQREAIENMKPNTVLTIIMLLYMYVTMKFNQYKINRNSTHKKNATEKETPLKKNLSFLLTIKFSVKIQVTAMMF